MRLVCCLILVLAGFAPAVLRAQDMFFDSNGVRIRYQDIGSGEPIVLIHGRGNTIETWSAVGVLPALAQDHRIIALDLRGHGKSDKPHDPNQYGPQMGQDVVRLMEHLKVPRAHIVAYSAGCSVVVNLLATNPERFLTASLIAGSGQRLPRWTLANIEADEAEAREIERSPQPGNDPAALAAMVRGRRNWVITAAQVEAIRVPIFAIVGSADPNVAGVRQFKEQKPSIEVTVVEDATHAGETGILRRRELLMGFRHFLKQHATPSGAAPGGAKQPNTYQPSPRQVRRSSPSGRRVRKTRDRKK